MTSFVPELSLALAFAATAISVFAFARAFSGQLPSVDLLVERGPAGEARYRFSVSNPTRRLIVLDYIEVLSPRPDEVLMRPMEVTAYGVTNRAYEEVFCPSKRGKPLFLAVPAGETRQLELELPDREDLAVRFRLSWSKGLPFPDRCFVVRKFALDSDQLRSRKLAADAKTD